MAAGAGSLGVLLGGAAIYHGVAQVRPPLGTGLPAGTQDIDRALGLIRRALALWVVAVLVGAGLYSYLNSGAVT